MCVCTHVGVCCVCVCACVSVHVLVCACAHVCVCVHTCIDMYTFSMGNTHVCVLRIGGEFSCIVSILVMEDGYTTWSGHVPHSLRNHMYCISVISFITVKL